MNNYKVALKGSYLPDIGGIAVHISRLAEALSDDGLLYCVYTTTNPKGYIENRFKMINSYYPGLRYGTFQSLFWLFKNFYVKKLSITHFHGHPVWESPTILLLLLLRKKVVFTIHDQMMIDNVSDYPKFLFYLFSKTINHRNIHWIAVSPNIKSQIKSIVPDCENITVIPAYLTTRSEGELLNEEIENFTKSRTKIISIYAHSIRTMDGKDMYGLDLALRALALVKKYYGDVGIIICIPNEQNNNQLESYLHIIDDLQLNDNVLFFLKPVNNPLCLWRRSDIVLRPTLTDGDSLVVREAISQGTYVIASDVVKRPEAVILFKSENIEDLSVKIIETLGKTKMTALKPAVSNYELIKNVYSNLILVS